MPKYKALITAAVLAGATLGLPATGSAAQYEYYIASEDAPLWLPPAPYPYMDAPPAVYTPNYYLNGPGASAHVEWCLARYHSYNPDTNMYLGYDGNFHRCRGPAS
ncbi:MAG: BA14K family protein [Rhizobiales bacterium]|nr:BA14K family protein [Hyphomicrobiales bacterium]